MGFDFFCVLSTGLKTPTVTNHNTAKTAAANQTAAKMAPTSNQALTKQASQYPLQRSGSARLSRLHSTGKGVYMYCIYYNYYLLKGVYNYCSSTCFVCRQGEICVLSAAGVSASENCINLRILGKLQLQTAERRSSFCL